MTTAIIQLLLSILTSIQNKRVVLGIKLSLFAVLLVVSTVNGEFQEVLKAVIDNMPAIATA